MVVTNSSHKVLVLNLIPFIPFMKCCSTLINRLYIESTHTLRLGCAVAFHKMHSQQNKFSTEM